MCRSCRHSASTVLVAYGCAMTLFNICHQRRTVATAFVAGFLRASRRSHMPPAWSRRRACRTCHMTTWL